MGLLLHRYSRPCLIEEPDLAASPDISLLLVPIQPLRPPHHHYHSLRVFTSEEEPLGLNQLVRRTVGICRKRIEGCLITSLYILLMSTSVFFGFFFAATNYLYIVSLIRVGDYSYYYYISIGEDGGSYTTRSSFEEDLSLSRILFDSVMALFHGAVFIVCLPSSASGVQGGTWVWLFPC